MRLSALFALYLVSTAATISTPFAIHKVQQVRLGIMPVNSEAALESAPALHPGARGPYQPIPACTGHNEMEYYADRDFSFGSDVNDRRSFVPDIEVHSCTAGNDGTLYLASGSDHKNWLRAYTPAAQLKWDVATDEIQSPLAVAPDSTVYLISMPRSGNTALTAYTADGDTKWRVDLAGFEWNPVPPAIGPDGTIYVYSGVQSAPEIVAITPEGQKLWKASVLARVSKLVVGPDGTVFVDVPAGHVIAFSPQGRQLWSFYSDAHSLNGGIAVTGDGTVYFTSGFLHALDGSGKEKWNFKSELTYTKGDYFDGTPVIAEDGTVYVASYYQQLYAVTPSGHKKWAYSGKSPDLPPEVMLTDDGILRTRQGWFSVSSGLATKGWPAENHDNRNSRSREAQ